MSSEVPAAPKPPHGATHALRLPLRLAFGLLLAFYGMCAPFLLVPTVVLLFVHETLSGLLLAVGVLATLSLPIAVLISRAGPVGKPRRYRAAIATGGVTTASLIALMILAPSGVPRPGSRATSHFPGPASYARFSFWNLLPEIDQVRLGIAMAPIFDSMIHFDQTGRIRDITMPLCRDMEQDPDFAALGSVCNYAWGSLFGGMHGTGHFYQYIPAHAADRKLPVILFLQGSTANFKSYLWVWHTFADTHGYAIVAPSFDFGSWNQPGGREAIERVRAYCAAHPEFDPARIYLAGLSNGGLGVSRAGRAHPTDYAGLVFLSAVTEDEVVTSPSFVRGWKGRDVLFIHGDADDRIALTSVQTTAGRMQDSGLRVKFVTFPGEDHFLFFSKREEMMTTVAEWLDEVEKRRPQ